MEIFRFNILPDEEFTKREIFKMSVLNCQICGGELEFHHQKESDAVIQEEAQCPSCRIQLKTQSFVLQ